MLSVFKQNKNVEPYNITLLLPRAGVQKALQETIINTNDLTKLSSIPAAQQQRDGRDRSLTSYTFQKLFFIIQS